MDFALVHRQRLSCRHPSAPQAQAEPRDTSPPYRNDPALVCGCLAGDETAWEKLVERYARLIYCVPRHYGLPDADAQDVMQNVFVIVYRRLNTLRHEERLSAWLLAIAHHETIKYLNGRNGERAELEIAECLDGTTRPLSGVPDDPEIRRIEQRELLRHALGRLTANERAVILALFVDGTPSRYEEIAEQTGIARGSLGPTRARALRKLQKVLKEMGLEV